MIIVSGYATTSHDVLSSGFIYNARTEQSTPLPNDILPVLEGFSAVSNDEYMYVIGGWNYEDGFFDTVYRLSLETYKWSTMAPMGTARYCCVSVLLGDCIYVFGGSNLVLVERYSIVGNTWEDLPNMPALGCLWTAALRNEIYVFGPTDRYSREHSLIVFDTVLLEWRTVVNMPGRRDRPAGPAVVIQHRYLVLIAGCCPNIRETAGCLIYDCSINRWSSTPASMNMITAPHRHTAAVLDGKIVVAGGRSRGQFLSTMECIGACDVLEYAPLHYPVPQIYFNRKLQLGRSHDDDHDDVA